MRVGPQQPRFVGQAGHPLKPAFLLSAVGDVQSKALSAQLRAAASSAMGKMAMDAARRVMVRDAEVPRLVLKSLIRSTRLPAAVRASAQRQLAEMPANTSATRIRQRCILTGRPRAVISDYRISRIKFREAASWGKIPGVCKVR